MIPLNLMCVFLYLGSRRKADIERSRQSPRSAEGSSLGKLKSAVRITRGALHTCGPNREAWEKGYRFLGD